MADYANFTNMRSLMTGLARAMNLVNPEMERHHEQTAYLSLFLAREMGLPEEDVMLTLYAALLHDIGAIVKESPQTLDEIESRAREISNVGSRMLQDLPGMSEIASIIGYCQCSWGNTVSCAIEEGVECERLGNLASIVHLSDVVATMLNPEERVLNQADRICEFARSCSGTEFSPRAVDALLAISDSEYIWLDLLHNPMFLTYFTGEIAPVSLDNTLQLTMLMSRIIDYRSPFTAMHSAGVAASAQELAKLAGLGEDCAKQVAIAGNLHDVGKLAVPRSILEKPGKLTKEEFNVVKEHPYYTSLVLLNLDGLEDIRHWAAYHHEKLSGNGYPFHFDEHGLDTGDQILAVADIFSAITEERPYRAGMPREKASAILKEEAQGGNISDDLVTLLIENYDQVDAARDEASHLAGKRYFDSLGHVA